MRCGVWMVLPHEYRDTICCFCVNRNITFYSSLSEGLEDSFPSPIESNIMERKLKSKSNRFPAFFKVLIGDFSEKLHIPAAYRKHFHGKFPQTIFLKSSTQRSWAVSLEKADEVLYLCNCWRDFVKDHALECGEFLVFKHDGESRFKVKIFGRNACEKEVSLPKKNSADPIYYVKEEEKVNELPGIKRSLNEFPKCIKKLKTDRQINGILKSEEICINTERRLDEKECSFATTFGPHKKYRLKVPAWVAKEQDLASKENVLLEDPNGRSWLVDVGSKKDGQAILSGGWSNFWLANNVADGDTCIFHFNRGTSDAIMVEVSRKGDNEERGLSMLRKQTRTCLETRRRKMLYSKLTA